MSFVYDALNKCWTMDGGSFEQGIFSLRGYADKFLADQEEEKLQRPNSEFIQHTPHEAQYTS